MDWLGEDVPLRLTVELWERVIVDERLRVTETVLDTERVGEVVPLMLPEMETEEVLLSDGLPELEAVAAAEPGVA